MGSRDICLSQSSRNRDKSRIFSVIRDKSWFFSLSAANRDFFRFPRYIAIMLAWTLTNCYKILTKRYETWLDAIIQADWFCYLCYLSRYLVSSRYVDQAPKVDEFTFNVHRSLTFSAVSSPTILQAVLPARDARFRQFYVISLCSYCDITAILPRQDRKFIFKNFACHGTAILDKFYCNEQTSPIWAVGRLEQGFAIYQPINSVIIWQ